MDFKDYSVAAMCTAVYEGRDNLGGISYCTLGLTGEAGEIANKVKKLLRKDFALNFIKDDLIEELGDVLWYVSELAENLGTTLDFVAQRNISKLRDRRARNVVRGSGDNR